MPEGKKSDEAEGKQKENTETFHDFTEYLTSGSSLTPRYKIIRLLGTGGMGRVYLAQDLDLNTDVALKVIRPELLADQKVMERFRNELILARKVSHRNVVRIHDIGETNGIRYLSMTYVQGRSLRDLLQSSGPFSVERAVAVMLQICEGVAAAHQEGVIHRDLKPSNILLDDEDRVYIADFGIARSVESSDFTATGSLVGTPAYFSPEQARGESAGTASDIFSIGLIFYETLAGKLPYDRETVEQFRTKGPVALETELRKIHPDIPDYVLSIIKKCLDPQREYRYGDLKELLNDLEQKTIPRTRGRFFQQKKKYWAIASAVLALLLGFLWYSSLPRKEQSTPVTTPVSKVPKPASLRSVAVLPFTNNTGKTEFAWIETALADLLISDLSQGNSLRVLSSDRVFQTLQDLKIPIGSYEQADTGRLSEILDVDAVLHGSLTQAGSLLRVDVKFSDSKSSGNPVYFKALGKKQEDLFPMINQLAQQIQQHFQNPISSSAVETSTVSIPALKAYNQGLESLRNGEFSAASTYFEDAVRQAPQFTQAYLKLSKSYEADGKGDEALRILQQALQKTDPKDIRSALMVRSQLALLQDDLDTAIDLYRQRSEKYPNDPDVLFDLSLAYEQKGDLKNAILTLEKLVEQDSNHPEAYFHLGKDTILMGDAEKAINRFLIRALSITTQLNNEFGQADVLNAMGVAYERLGRYDDAIKYYKDSLAIKEKIGNQKGIATSLNNIAKIHVFRGEYEEAQKILNRTVTILEKLDDRQGIAGAMNMFGVINEDQGFYDRALQYYKKALQVRKDLGNDQLTAQSYDNVGQIYYLLMQYDDAQVYWEQALSLRKTIGEESGIILSLQNIGSLQLAQGKLDKATKSLLEALNRSRAIKYENAIAVSLGNLGAIYQHQGRYDAALDSYQEAVDVLRRLQDKKGVAEYTKSMGGAFLELQNLGEAQEKLKSAEALAKEIGSADMIADLQILLGKLRRLQGNLQEADRAIEDAMKLAVQQNYQGALIRGKIEKSFLLTMQQKFSDARRILDEAIKGSKETDDVWLGLSSDEAAAFYWLQSGDFSRAIESAGRGIAVAEKMGLTPVLYRLHFLAAHACLSSGKSEQARQHFRQSAAAIDQMKKETRAEYISGLLQTEETRQIYQGMK